MKYDNENAPNAGRLVESLRFLGYGNYEAVADIADNSVDAGAHHLKIRIFQRENEPQIWIADDGSGMDTKILDQAMRLGSLVDRDANSDLGKFGMGLVTASLSMARRCQVITKGPDGYLSSAWDVDEIIKQNAFYKYFAKADKEEVAVFNSLLDTANTGTVVMLSKCDFLTNRNLTSFASNLKSHLGRVHRYFLTSSLEIAVNNEMVSPIDPLQLQDAQTEIVMDDQIQVSIGLDGNKRIENVRVRVVLVPETPATELDIGRSMKSQGFYIMRNQREIMNAATLDFFTKHNDFNRMRGEIFFPGTMDRLVGIEFTKRQVNLDQSLHDQLASYLVPTCRHIKRSEATKKRVETSPLQDQIHKQSAKAIAEKDKLLVKPKARIEKRSSPQHSNPNADRKEVDSDRERKNLTRIQAIEAKLNCEIREEKLGPNGQIYECDLVGRKIVLRYNVEHPFYQRFVSDNIHEARLVNATDFLIYSMAAAELRMVDDGATDAVNNFKAVLSANLRTLLN